MTYQEKGAWVVLVLLIFVYGGYGWHLVQQGGFGGLSNMTILIGAIGYLVTMIVGTVVGYIILAAMHPSEAEQMDERTKLYDLRADRISGWVLSGVLALVMGVGFLHGDMVMFHIGLFGQVAAELVRQSVKVILYRKDVL